MNKNSLPRGFEEYAFGKICFEPAQKETINNGNIFCFRNTDEALSALGVDKENLDLSCERYWNGADIKISNLISSNKFPISKDPKQVESITENGIVIQDEGNCLRYKVLVAGIGIVTAYSAISDIIRVGDEVVVKIYNVPMES